MALVLTGLNQLSQHAYLHRGLHSSFACVLTCSPPPLSSPPLPSPPHLQIPSRSPQPLLKDVDQSTHICPGLKLDTQAHGHRLCSYRCTRRNRSRRHAVVAQRGGGIPKLEGKEPLLLLLLLLPQVRRRWRLQV